MNEVVEVQPYQAVINAAVIKKWGRVPVWNEPKSAVEGAKVLDEIKEPITVSVSQEQKDLYQYRPQRAKITYNGGSEGWVIYDALIKK